MRKRSEIAASQKTEETPDDRLERELIAETSVQERNRERTARLPEAALARYAEFYPGDQLMITIGQELYSPVKYNTFTVGPFAATVVVRPNETGADAAMRCYRVLLELQEAEFNIAWGRMRERLSKMPRQG